MSTTLAEKTLPGLLETEKVVDVTHQNPRLIDGVASYEVVRSFGLESEVELVLDGRPIGRWPVEVLLPGVTKP